MHRLRSIFFSSSLPYNRIKTHLIQACDENRSRVSLQRLSYSSKMATSQFLSLTLAPLSNTSPFPELSKINRPHESMISEVISVELLTEYKKLSLNF